MRIQRDPPRPDGIFGTLSREGALAPFAVTLEHAYLQPDGNYLPNVPAGTYVCQKRMSPHFGYPVFMLLDVPGHDFIEIHRANWQDDLKGCIGLGAKILMDPAKGMMITDSRDTFLQFMEDHEGISSFPLTILDAPTEQQA